MMHYRTLLVAAISRAVASTIVASAVVGAWPVAASPLTAQEPRTAQEPLTLSEAASAALRFHPTAAAATARADAAGAELDQARASRLPGVSLGAEVTHFQEPMIVAPLHSFDVTNRPRFDETLVQGRLGVAYTLFDGGARGARIDAAGAGAGGAAATAESVEAELLAQVTRAYVGLMTTRAVRDAAASQVEALAAERDRALRRVDTGTAPRVQLLRAEATLQDARARLATAESRVGLAERTLARLTGASYEDVVGRPLLELRGTAGTADATGAAREASTAASGEVDAASEDRLALDDSPHLAAAARRVEAASAAVAAERASRLPRLDAGAALLDFGTLTGEHVLEWQAGVRLSWPVFTGGARSAALRRAEAGLREAQSDLASVRLQLQGSADAARTALADARARVEALEASVAQWTEVARIEALALDTGAGVQSDLLRAQAGLFQATAGLAQARADAVMARADLAQALGILDMEWINQQLESR